MARWRLSSRPMLVNISWNTGWVLWSAMLRKSVEEATSPIMNEVNSTASGYLPSEAE